MHPAFSRADHRPWPLPSARWTWRQSWRELLFAHWPVPTQSLRAFVPAGLEIDEFDGTSWVGLVPFQMTGVMRRPLPDLPWLSAFPELNVRLYVDLEGKPGVWFLSLDATNPLAVWAARRFFHLPYYRANMSLTRDGEHVRYDSQRPDGTAVFSGCYRPTGDVYQSKAGTLEHWLTERYCLYAQKPTGQLTRTQIHHVPWPLQNAEAEIFANTFFDAHALDITDPPAHLLFASRLDVVVWSPENL